MSLLRINKTPSPSQLRVFAGAFLLVVGALGWAQGHQGRHALAYCLAALALTVALAGLVFPKGLRPLYLGLTYAAYPFGVVISHGLLGALFYLVLSPIGLLMRLCGRDPLSRRFEPGRASYWTRREGTKTVQSYFHQN